MTTFNARGMAWAKCGACAAISCIIASAMLAASAQERVPAQANDQATPPQTTTVPLPAPTSLTEALLLEIEVLKLEVQELRAELAQAHLSCNAAQRELDELRQFVADHDRYGDDFEQYRAVKQVAEQESRERELEAARQRRAEERAVRAAERRAARAEADARNAEANRIAEYRRNGFTALGLDVFGGKMAFYYNTKSGSTGAQVDYDTLIGNYLRPGFPYSEIDYSQMTISGSILNASDVVRHIGVAITFFDDNGNQVGHETIEVRNARPNVPYPFTSKIEMALNRPFDSSSTYVLYADPVDG